MKKQNKYVYLWVVQGSYSQGWVDLTTSENYKEAWDDFRSYRDNETEYFYRIIKRRELNTIA